MSTKEELTLPSTPINYTYIGEAVKFYKARGYGYIEVPWLANWKAINVTKPGNTQAMCLEIGREPLACFVGYAEQSFIQMMLDQTLPYGLHCAVTPCFREEQIYSETTRPYFMKVELIAYYQGEAPDESMLYQMIRDADTFMGDLVPLQQVQTIQGVDIVAKYSGLELGSYGIRNWENHNWIYGTGCAEPRFSHAVRGFHRES